MTDISASLRLSRKQLGEIFRNNPVAVRAFENIFEQVVNQSSNTNISIQNIAEASNQTAIEALDLVSALIKDVALLLTTPKYAESNRDELHINFNNEFIGDIYATKDEMHKLIEEIFYPPQVNEDLQSIITTITNNSVFSAYAINVDLNTAITADTPINIVLPSGFTKYRINSIQITDPTTTPTAAALAGVYTAAAQGGVVVAAQQSLVLTSNANDTNGNMFSLALTNANSTAFSAPTLYFNVGTSITIAHDYVKVSISYTPLP